MRVLALDSSSLKGSVAVIEGEDVKAEVMLGQARKQTGRLAGSIDYLFEELSLKPVDIDGVAVGIGPGSFTAVRIGLSIAKGFALSLGIPIVGVISLEVLAFGVRFFPGPIVSLLDARKGELFAGIYEKGGASLKTKGDLMVIKPAELLDKIPDGALLVGEGARVYEDFFRDKLKRVMFAGPEFDFPRAGILGLIGARKIESGFQMKAEELVPLYLRPTDAELARMKEKKS